MQKDLDRGFPILPCACGSNSVTLGSSWPINGEFRIWIECKDCHFRGPSFSDNSPSGGRDEIRKLWNGVKR